MILNIYKNLIKNKKIRVSTALVLVFVSLIFLVFPVLIKPEIDEAVYKGGRHFSEMSGRNEIELGADRQRQNTEPLPIEKNENSDYESFGLDKKETLTDKDPVHSSQQHDRSGEGSYRGIPSNIYVMGSMTLIEVAEKYEVPVDHIKSKLDVPLSTSDNERFGRLRRELGFTMSDVEEIIYNYQKAKETNNEKQD